jgi:hypothetical protein
VVVRSFGYLECGFESHRSHGCLSLVSVVGCQVEVYVTGRFLFQRSPTECCASAFDLKTTILRKLRPRTVEPLKNNTICECTRTRNTYFSIHMCMFSVDLFLNNFRTNDARLLFPILQKSLIYTRCNESLLLEIHKIWKNLGLLRTYVDPRGQIYIRCALWCNYCP